MLSPESIRCQLAIWDLSQEAWVNKIFGHEYLSTRLLLHVYWDLFENRWTIFSSDRETSTMYPISGKVEICRTTFYSFGSQRALSWVTEHSPGFVYIAYEDGLEGAPEGILTYTLLELEKDRVI